MFLRNDHGLELAGGGAARSVGNRAFGRVSVATPDPGRLDWLRSAAAGIDWAPDLGAQIGSRDWWRGLATFTALCGTAWALGPTMRPLVGATPSPLSGAAFEEVRGQGIAPLAWGGDTGRRMAANDLVAPLAEAPERPIVDLAATLGEGDDLDHVLMRAGVGRGDARAAAALIAQTVPLGDIQPGTRIALTLGRRPARTVARPLEKLALRARFDLAVSLDRAGAGLVMTRRPIAIDATPLRIQGLVGSSLYRSARAAGAPARVVESYIKALATRLSIGRDVGAADSFDLIVEQQRAATGETRLGDLLFAGIDQGRRKVQLVRWQDEGKPAWFDAKGQSERRGFMGMPVAGRITSSFGYRMHPLLGYLKMHKGLDIGAPYGSPIYAALDGVVQGAGRSGGYGNFVKLVHGGGLASGYGHMSRIAVARGEHVRQGQVIGYVGSTGLSTGPHLHWEVWRNGQTINPRAISFASMQALSGEALRRFRARVAGLLAVKVGQGG
ncbi:M23 family metallopeptidase [Sphingomonas sp. A2-49]|uniref:M23 family metallopeptidase n=1 Tax=Sphingomonas sp. A2-49 TaxID=1391375 RepID=UPI0021D2AF2D|nr:M23 family metallopeptidase [Sphingomonas sp. A2-49]MCU6455196.1 M23 family metallopeptidase [Sphingomonas sp. A2-49]